MRVHLVTTPRVPPFLSLRATINMIKYSGLQSRGLLCSYVHVTYIFAEPAYAEPVLIYKMPNL